MTQPNPAAPDRLSSMRGSVVALATPFRNGAVDCAAVAELSARQAEHGSAGIVVCGSTGEGPALSEAEHTAIIAAAVAATEGRLPIIAGCGAASTAAAATLARHAGKAGASALLCAAPPYVKPTQDGIIAHIRSIAEAAHLPIMLYDIPARVGVGVADDTIARLFEAGCIVAIKDASGDLARPARLRALCGNALVQMAGDDAIAAGYRAMGGHGCVSVTANLVPALCAALHAAWDRGDMPGFAHLRDLLAPLHQALFAESNPIPLKAAMEIWQLCGSEIRLPLTEATAATRKTLEAILAEVQAAEAVAAARQWRKQALPRELAGG